MIQTVCSYAIMILLLLPLGVSGEEEQVKYVDASNVGDPHRNGTQSHPFVSMEEAGISSHTTYYLKRSARYILTKPVIISGKEEIRISAYGKGSNPVLYAGNLKKAIDVQNSHHITLSNLSLEGKRDTDYLLRVIGNSSTVLINQSTFQSAVWGIRLIGFNPNSRIKDVRIQSCKISQTGDDGIFANQVEGLVIDSCRISQVNQKWFYASRKQGVASGDGIQIGKSRAFIISNCRIDRSDTGNKFCIIALDSQGGKITGNRLQGPITKGDGGASIYLGKATDSIEVSYNDIAGSMTGIYNKSRHSLIYRNTIRHNETGLWSGSRGICQVMNNTFYNNKLSLGGDRLRVTNNIFYNDSLPGVMIQFKEDCQSDHNCYYNNDMHRVFSNHGSLKIYQAVTRHGTSSVFADPRFAHTMGYDLRLAEDSPCIDRGLEAETLPFDMNFCGDRVDVGAWEYCPDSIEKNQTKKKYSLTFKTNNYE